MSPEKSNYACEEKKKYDKSYIKRKELKKKDDIVVVFEVANDCILKKFKPVFLYQKPTIKRNFSSFYNDELDLDLEEDDDIFDSILTPKDILDLNCAVENVYIHK